MPLTENRKDAAELHDDRAPNTEALSDGVREI